MNRSAILLVLCALCSLTFAAWTVVDQDFATIAMSTSFVGSTTGYVAGGSGSLQPLFLYTTNGGSNFTNQGMSDSTVGAFLSIRMGSPTWGIAGALGFLTLPCGAYTNDGHTWVNMDESGGFLFCAFQGAAVVDDNQTGVLIGSFSDRRDLAGNGIQITTNAGQTWSQYNGNFGTTPVRYGSFQSANQGYVTGGIWPEADPAAYVQRTAHYPISRHLSLDTVANRVVYNRHKERVGLDGYVAVLSSVTNAGKNWNLLLNITNGGLYFNEISCTDANNCWAVLEGVDSLANDTASIYYTSDGWATYEVQLTVPGGSLVAIDMASPTYGWAVGALVQGDVTGDFDALFYVTNDGQTWTAENQIKNFFPMDVTIGDSNNVYAAGITPVGLSSFARYSP